MNMNKDIKDCILKHLQDSGKKESSDPLLNEWLDEDEANRKDFSLYKRIWKELQHYIEKDQFNVEAAWRKTDAKIRNQKLHRRRMKNAFLTVYGVAASLILVLAFSTMEFFTSDNAINVDMTVNYGNRSDITLPDGSVVKLNSGSTISYTYHPKRKIREINFHGEGFFKVAKKEQPFVIRMNNGPELKVLGTSFNLRAYPDEDIIQTSLVEGSVQLVYEEKKVKMKAGEMIIFNKNDYNFKYKEGVLLHTYSWLENKLYMDNMSLTDVCKNLERRYDVIITLQKNIGNDIHYNGVLQEETITDILDALTHLSQITYQVNGKHICITKKE